MATEQSGLTSPIVQPLGSGGYQAQNGLIPRVFGYNFADFSKLTPEQQERVRQDYLTTRGIVYDSESKKYYNKKGQEVVAPTDYDLASFYDSQQNAENYGKVSQKLQNLVTSADVMLQGASSKIQNQSVATQGINSLYDFGSNFANQFGPTGQIVGGAMKVGGLASDALTAFGMGTSQLGWGDKLLDSKQLKLTPLGLMNDIGANTLQDFSANKEVLSAMGSSYGGSTANINKASDLSGKTVGLFSSGLYRRYNNFISDARRQQNMMEKIMNEEHDQHELVANMGDQASNTYAFNQQGGYDQRFMRFAEEGGTIEEPQEEWKPVISPRPPRATVTRRYVDSRQEGGIMGSVQSQWSPVIIEKETVEIIQQPSTLVEKQLDAPIIEDTPQQNIIPEGALHKEKHHIEHADHMTKKGIPVIDHNDEQQAEIERNEIIFTKEVTNMLEELWKIYTAENTSEADKIAAAIDCGKLLTKEIMLNTDDRTGLIDSLKQGGVISRQDGGSVKPDYEQWVMSVPEDFVNDNYDLRMAYEHLPYEMLELWKKSVSANPIPPGTNWHLPSILEMMDENDEPYYIFLKKGKNTLENPELEFEFEAYNSPDRKDFRKAYKMKFDSDNNRWTYMRR